MSQYSADLAKGNEGRPDYWLPFIWAQERTKENSSSNESRQRLECKVNQKSLYDLQPAGHIKLPKFYHRYHGLLLK